MGKTKKLDYIDYYRAIAIILIVAGHDLVWGRSTMFEVNGMIFAGATYFFVFIAGYLFQHLSYKFDIKTYYKKKLLNVICPYFITILPVAYVFSYYSQNPHVLKQSSHNIRFLATLFNGSFVNYPTWFIGMIVIIFLISPFILKLKQKNKIIYLTLFICSFVYTLITIRHGLSPDVYPLVKFAWVNFISYFQNALHFLFFYLLGMEMCDLITNYSDKIKPYLKTAFYISLFVYIFHFVVHLFIIKTVYNLQLVSKLIETFVLLFGVILIEKKIQNNALLNKFLKLMAEYSFGIFFIHGIVQNLILFHTIYNQPNAKPLIFLGANTLKCALTSVCLFITVLFGSVLTLFILKTILKKLGVKNTRMFIGV